MSKTERARLRQQKSRSIRAEYEKTLEKKIADLKQEKKLIIKKREQKMTQKSSENTQNNQRENVIIKFVEALSQFKAQKSKEMYDKVRSKVVNEEQRA